MSRKVAVLLATYNGGEYLCEQLNSIEMQTYSNWHLFVSDDGSNDDTLEIIKAFQIKNFDRVTIVSPSEPVKGAKENFFHLIHVVPRGYSGYCFCDQDDRWYPGKIEKSLLALESIGGLKEESPCLTFCDARVVNDSLDTISDSFVSYTDVNPMSTSLAELLVQNPISGAEMMINECALNLAARATVLQGIDMHDQWIGLITSLFGRISYIDEPLFDYRQHGYNTVGAKKMGITSIGDKAREADDSLRRKEVQAARLIDTFQNELKPAQLQMLEGFSGIKKLSKLNRIRFLVSNGIRMNGLLRNLGLFVYI